MIYLLLLTVVPFAIVLALAIWLGPNSWDTLG